MIDYNRIDLSINTLRAVAESIQDMANLLETVSAHVHENQLESVAVGIGDCLETQHAALTGALNDIVNCHI